MKAISFSLLLTFAFALAASATPTTILLEAEGFQETGGWVIDTPGLKVLGLWQVERDDLDSYYPEMVQHREYCRFVGCSHISEPDCAVKDAVETGEISRLRYNNYCQIYESL